jgi:Amt family ammonium transporter
MTTNTASAAAMLGWVFFDAVRGRRPSALGAAVGAVVGLVAITPAAGYVTVGQSIAVGLIAAVVSNMAVHWKSKSALDDTLDVFPCHGVGGIVGMVLTGVFAEKVGLIHGDPTVFLRHLAAIVVVGVYSFGGSWVLYRITDAAISLRVRPEQETAGLDLSQHDESLSRR